MIEIKDNHCIYRMQITLKFEECRKGDCPFFRVEKKDCSIPSFGLYGTKDVEVCTFSENYVGR
jgi:hypothetical protein